MVAEFKVSRDRDHDPKGGFPGPLSLEKYQAATGDGDGKTRRREREMLVESFGLQCLTSMHLNNRIILKYLRNLVDVLTVSKWPGQRLQGRANL